MTAARTADTQMGAMGAVGPPPPAAVPRGDLDEFRLLQPLGRGGMGTVYLGHDTVLDRPVAIKLIGARDPDAASRDRFLTEARAIARLSHPNVVHIHRVGTTGDGRPYLVQELIRGASLDRMPVPLPWRRVCELGTGIARGLAAAHRRGILHRDVKPGNVMVGDDGVARLLDFGLAKLSHEAPEPVTARGSAPAMAPAADPMPSLTADPDGSDRGEVAPWPSGVAMAATAPGPSPAPVHATAPGALIGTPRYAAPEIWRGEPATAQSDLYSLGALLYELVVGRPPHAELDMAALRTAVLDGAPAEVAATGADLPPALARIIERCLARDVGRRPESADALGHDLELLLAGAPALPDGNPYRGLSAFDADHRGYFFGRGADVGTVVDRLRAEPVLVIAGDSGIGKSSLCRAGVLPAITSGGLGDHRQWRAIALSPGRRPYSALCDALSVAAADRGLPAAELIRALRPGPDHGIVLFVDHLEELITIADGDEARRAAELLAAIGDGVIGWKALVAVRGDFLTRVAALPALGDPLSRGLHLLRVLTAADLREAVVGPARARGVHFASDDMVDALVATVDHRAGALPLLQFALAELWTERDDAAAVIPAAAVARIGGVAGALARHADAVVRGLGGHRRDAARRVLVGLVTATGTRAVRDRDELIAGDDAAAAALEALVRGRLVIARDGDSGAAAYELAHEQLIASWATLRGWLADDAGARASRDRLLAAAAEWRRLDQPADLLWTARQLAEVTTAGDAPAATAFLAASRRQARRRRLGRGALLIGVPAMVIATAAAVRVQAVAARDRAADHYQARAAVRRSEAATAAATAARHRAAAFNAFTAGATGDGEAAWTAAGLASREARRGYRETAVQLEAALQIGGDRGDLRARMADVILDHARIAEADHDHDGVAELIERLGAYDPLRVTRVWRQPAQLTIDSGRDVSITVRGAAEVWRGRGRVDAELAPGDYAVELTADDGLTVHQPLRLGRGERLDLAIPLPPATAIPDGYAYLAAGRFLAGSRHDDLFRRTFQSAAPLHVETTGAYLIARHEVTFGDWMSYLRALPAAERARRLPGTAGGSQMRIALDPDARGGFALTLQPSTVAYRAAEGEPLTYPDRPRRQRVRWEQVPVSGVSFDDGQAYAAWLAASGRVAGARLCTEAEWERAARGADGRLYPHGDTLADDDANLDVTYGRRALGYGPDEVGAHPRSNSPFAVADLAGNAWEWVRGRDGAVLRGGGWYHGAASALTMNREPNEPAIRHTWAGLRICADAPAAR